MFKRSKTKASRGEPTTPKIQLAPLPDADSWAGSPPPQPKAFAKSFKPFFGRLIPDRRAETPLQAQRPSYRSDGAYVPRLRTVSMSKQEDDVMMRRGHPPYDPVYARPVKPGEVVYNVYPSQRPVDRVPNIHRSSTLRSSPKYVDPLVAEIPPTQHRPKYVDPPVVERLPAQPTYVEHPAMKQSARRPSTRYMDPSVMKQVAPVSMTPPERAHQPEQRPAPAPLKSALKKGKSQRSTAEEKQELLPPALERHASSRWAPTEPGLEHSNVGQGNRSRKLSLTGQQRPAPPQYPNKPKYVSAIVNEAMKGEAIALSWPLVDFQSRKAKGMPLVYFDAGFNPRSEDMAVRVWREKWFSPITRKEATIPVSFHTVLTEMTIECIPPRGFPEHFILWPIHVRRLEGLRCIDIFRAVFEVYHELLTEKEKARIGSHYLQWCEKAFKKRCEDSPGLPLYNESCGMRRIDMLRGRRIFKSLSQDSTNSRWELRFDDPSPEKN
ncbi:hypothetical protein AGABI1DRAFT_107064 [Agaricus bisporus var. burnettii JB137-S8]|uniref:DUF6699 domain-containing protein n=1 Tax=Agaricus bisporus var. burnettii (strain JB137-S8 / ATCC MYA-4627 / FGSC 10392) TaxID=597362 RepID=K5VYU9_AGABU|nr:uncharacterized protein AGABI1DRAFT_107064 [Agaricus bisporus var. burnettii JB137-S8]EKM79654.1 hypothetical protein AGABI1DRAFT_107064 [Agaricus bisporus var. burnettii JB137-S8]